MSNLEAMGTEQFSAMVSSRLYLPYTVKLKVFQDNYNDESRLKVGVKHSDCLGGMKSVCFVCVWGGGRGVALLRAPWWLLPGSAQSFGRSCLCQGTRTGRCS